MIAGVAVDTLPGQVVVNVGDMLQRLTNHVLVSTTHRVVNPPTPWSERARYYPEDDAYLLEREPFVSHYEVLISASDIVIPHERPA